MTLLNHLFVFLTLINITYLFVLGHLVPGFSSYTFSLFSMFFYFIYILFNKFYISKILGNKLVFLSMICFLFIPFLVSFINYAISYEFFDLRAHGERILGFLLFLSTLIFCNKNNKEVLLRLILLTILITCVGIFLSLVNPYVFIFALEAINAKSVLSGRAFGFYLQPNSAAMALCFFFVLYHLFSNKNPSIIVSFIIFVCIALTASRSGLAIFVIIFILLYFKIGGIGSYKDMVTSLSKMMILILILPLVFFVSNLFYQQAGNVDAGFSGKDRLEAIIELDVLKTDEYYAAGGNERQYIALQYIELLKEQPFGYGIGISNHLKEKGVFHNSAHNQYLSVGVESGVITVFLIILLVSKIYSKVKRQGYKYEAISFVLMLFLFSFFINNILNLRYFYFYLALFIYISSMKKNRV